MPLATNMATDLAAAREATDLATSIATGMGAASAATPATILGSNLVEYWDSLAGVGLVSGAVDTWTGQKAGIVLSAAAAGNRPVYGADSTYFRGKSVIQAAFTGSKYLRNLDTGVDIIANGVASKPWICSVFRLRSAPAAVYARVLDFGANHIFIQHNTGTDVLWGTVKGSDNTQRTAIGSAAGTAVHMIEAWADNGPNIRTDMGATVTSAGADGITTAATVRVVGVGGYAFGTANDDYSIRASIICTAKPTDAQCQALYTYFRSDSGF